MADTARARTRVSSARIVAAPARLARRTIQAVGIAGLALLVLLGAVQLALVQPAEEHLSPLVGSGRLERSAPPRGLFSPLRPAFIDHALGLGLPVGAPVSGRRGSTPTGAAAAPGQGVGPRIVVAHALNNDDFGSAFGIDSISFTGKTDTTAAGREAGEPGGCAPLGGTVWYRYRADRNLGLVVSTIGSNYATGLGIFTGRNLADLRLVGCDTHPLGNTQVVFPGTVGQTYFFQVAGPAGGGDLVFNLDPLGATSRVSRSTAGRQGDGYTGESSISADGRYVAFDSFAGTLVDGDTNVCPPYGTANEPSCPDVFVHDQLTGVTERVSISSEGRQADGPSQWPAISGDGRHVAFWSRASNLASGDTNGLWDVFVHDRLTRRTERVSVSSSGAEGRGPLSDPNLVGASVSVSFDGRLVAFASDLTNLVDGDGNACTAPGQVDPGTGHPEPVTHLPGSAIVTCRDIFVRDRLTHGTTRVSVSSSGEEATGDSAGVFISVDGRHVAFSSDAANLVEGDDNGYRDVFVHDRATRTTELVSVSASGRPGDSNSGGAGVRGHNTISTDGRYVAFVSFATNLVPEDGDTDPDAFVRDRRTGKTLLLSGDGPGETGDHSTISADGRFVAFSALVPVSRGGEESYQHQLFVYDVSTGITTQVSVSSAGQDADGLALEPEISADGRHVSFQSDATNLVDNDDNGEWDVFVHEVGWAR